MIDKIWVLNVLREAERRQKCRQALLDKNVPAEMISIFRAKSFDSYKSLIQLRDDIIADGFDFFCDVDVSEAKYGLLAQTWSYLSFLRHIQETQETAILIHDDHKLNCDWEELKDAIDSLPHQDDLLIAKISCHLPTDTWATPKWVTIHSAWCSGSSNPYDAAILYTPAGARFFEQQCIANMHSLRTGWIWGHLLKSVKEVVNNNNIYELWINPTAENMQNILSIKASIAEMIADRNSEYKLLYCTAIQHPEILNSCILDATGDYLEPEQMI